MRIDGMAKRLPSMRIVMTQWVWANDNEEGCWQIANAALNGIRIFVT